MNIMNKFNFNKNNNNQLKNKKQNKIWMNWNLKIKIKYKIVIIKLNKIKINKIILLFKIKQLNNLNNSNRKLAILHKCRRVIQFKTNKILNSMMEDLIIKLI